MNVDFWFPDTKSVGYYSAHWVMWLLPALGSIRGWESTFQKPDSLTFLKQISPQLIKVHIIFHLNHVSRKHDSNATVHNYVRYLQDHHWDHSIIPHAPYRRWQAASLKHILRQQRSLFAVSFSLLYSASNKQAINHINLPMVNLFSSRWWSRMTFQSSPQPWASLFLLFSAPDL